RVLVPARCGETVGRARARRPRGGVVLPGALAVPEPGVAAAEGEELGVAAALDDAALLEHDDAVGIDHGREAVGNGDDAAAPAHGAQRLLDLPLGPGAQRARRLDAEADLRVLEDGSG